MTVESLPHVDIDPALDWQPACDVTWFLINPNPCGDPAIYACESHASSCWKHKFMCATCHDIILHNGSICDTCGYIEPFQSIRNEVRI